MKYVMPCLLFVVVQMEGMQNPQGQDSVLPLPGVVDEGIESKESVKSICLQESLCVGCDTTIKNKKGVKKVSGTRVTFVTQAVDIDSAQQAEPQVAKLQEPVNDLFRDWHETKKVVEPTLSDEATINSSTPSSENVSWWMSFFCCLQNE